MTTILTATELSTKVEPLLPVATIADLQELAKPDNQAHVWVQGYYAAGDGGGGEFYFDAASSATANGGTIIAPDAGGTGRWRRIYDVLTAEHYGAKGDAVTNDLVAFQGLAASGAKHVHAHGTYLITGTVSPPSGQVWHCEGATFSFASSTATMFSWVGKDDWGMVGPFIIAGDGSTVGTAKGIAVEGCNRWRLENYTAKTIKGWGLYITPGTPSGTLRGDQGQVTDYQALSCYVGTAGTVGAGVEYCTFVAPMITGCGTGFDHPAGNVTVLGGNIVDNTVGVHITNGTNHAHGIFSGVNINHNTTYNIHCVQVVNGQSFADCHIYGDSAAGSGALFFDRCKGIVLDGGHLDVNRVYNDSGAGSGQNIIRNMYCPGGYGDITLDFATTDGKSELWFAGCYGPGAYMAGVSINDPGPVYLLAERAIASTQGLTSGVLADLIFPTETFDRRKAFDNATGIFTVPAAQAGTYRVTANCVFGGTAMDVLASYLEIKIDGTARAISLPSIYSTTILNFEVVHELYLNAAQTVKLAAAITGTNPTFGHASYLSSLQITRIA